MKRIIIFIILCCFTLCSCSSINQNIEEDKPKETQNKKIIATWVTYQEIKELVDVSDNENEFNRLINEKLSILKKYSINTIFLHVRAFDDCFYKSDIFSVSAYCSSEDGSLKFDVLKNFIDVCKSLDIKLHAWINPYRIRNDSDTNKIKKDTFAHKLLSDNSEKIIVTDNSIYYNPAYIEVQNYILNGIKEILNNYSVDGIHIDDYFYPTTVSSIDSIIYNEYLSQGGQLSLFEFRRQNVSSLVSSIYSLIKSYNKNILFSISPNADINKNYDNLFADVTKWMKEDDYVDYIIPQIYFGYENADMPFKNVLDNWISANRTKLIIGLGIYKSGKKDIYAKSGENEWVNQSNIISKQIVDSFGSGVAGISLYSSSFFTVQSDNLTLEKEKQNIIEALEIYET